MSQLENSIQDLHLPLRRRNGHPRCPARGGRRLRRQAQTRDKVVFHQLDIVRYSRCLSGQYCLNLYDCLGTISTVFVDRGKENENTCYVIITVNYCHLV